MANDLQILEEAISEMGYWTWWTTGAPDLFQVEFDATLLWNRPIEPNGPPSGKIALRFSGAKSVNFIARSDHSEEVGADWPQRLQDDDIHSFSIDHGEFTLTSHDQLFAMIEQSTAIETIVGERPRIQKINSGDAILGFWAGPVGLVLIAGGMTIVSRHGEVPLKDIGSMHKKWWAYWREYHERRDSDHPLPYDFACEISIPIQGPEGDPQYP